MTPHIVAFGMTDIWRIPKEAYFFYQGQWSSKSMVHIVRHWTWPGEENQNKTIKVYSNALVWSYPSTGIGWASKPMFLVIWLIPRVSGRLLCNRESFGRSRISLICI